MEGVNAAGKRVSLLCDAGAPREGQREREAQWERAGKIAPSSAAATAPAPATPSQGRLPSLASLPYRAPAVSHSHAHTHSHSLTHTHTHAHTHAQPARPGPRPLVHPYTPSSSFFGSRNSIAAHSVSSSSTSTSASASSSSTQSYSSDSDSTQSRNSSIASRYSPPARAVPHLSRHDSSSTQRSLATPSPMTPVPSSNYDFPLDPQGKAAISLHDPSFSFIAQPPPVMPPANHQTAVATPNVPYYPSPAQGALPVSASQTNIYGGFPNLQQPAFDEPFAAIPPAQVQYQFATNLIEQTPLATAGLASPTSLSAAPIPPVDPSTAPATSKFNDPGSATKAKKKYPCPHAAKFNCHDTFTTSGHAARHGKKHTGEKNILCPTCHKAFTRKDNMKQHERTHKNNRNNDADASKPGAAAGSSSRRTQSISSIAASTVTHKSSNSPDMDVDDSPTADVFDSQRSSTHVASHARPAQYSGSNSTGSGEFKFDLTQHRPELNRQFSGESQDGEGESPGLDALAMAATSELR